MIEEYKLESERDEKDRDALKHQAKKMMRNDT